MSKQLKPCPFCGGIAEFKQFANPKSKAYVECCECHCHTDGYRYGSQYNSFAENKKIHAEIWNSRIKE